MNVGWYSRPPCGGQIQSTTQKMKFSIKNFFSKCDLFPTDLITLTGERFNGKLHFCVVHRIYIYKKKKKKMQGNVNLPGQTIIESLFYLSFQR